MAHDERDFYTDLTVVNDPKPYFDSLRAECPVLRERHQDSVMVTGYDEVVDVLNRKADVFSSVVTNLGPIPPLPFQPDGDDISEQLDACRDDLPWSAHLVCFDGKKHTDHRALLTRLLTHKRLRENEDYLVRLSDRLIDGFIGEGRCNVVPDYAHATTTYAISDLMGVPEADRAELLALIGVPPSQIEGEAPHRVGADPLVFLKERFDSYVKDRTQSPKPDLLTELASSVLNDGTRPSPEMLSLLARFLFAAGQDTTSKLITMAVKVLAEQPELQDRLRREPDRIRDFLEETLRYDPPVRTIYRLAQKRTAVAGVDIPAGTVVVACLTAANNDPTHFDAPETFDIDRPRVRDQVAFSRGAHGCPGAPLARLEARVAIERLLVRTANIRISEQHHGPEDDRQYRYEPTYSFRSICDLHIEFDPA